jgi:hypothetical protein
MKAGESTGVSAQLIVRTLVFGVYVFMGMM